ncbi:hypothetical protein GGTG_04742 [Gaeumannomyces tritici R3-111a-1]|uniref:Uncharacterized protein n=1 Tax=Gaeumannomyces tritici (strain R3-111a-1) TaxID=644352 RepID=J3NTZ3_GAET3|nr:hypothetical protein GGTG_04742 [Gaeumannomyces tritici R3-111a-1]EJT79658.1 hypothetical protein GGTG_04742 [Gaeumannomyces tritici R3-111a-1]
MGSAIRGSFPALDNLSRAGFRLSLGLQSVSAIATICLFVPFGRGALVQVIIIQQLAVVAQPICGIGMSDVRSWLRKVSCWPVAVFLYLLLLSQGRREVWMGHDD